MDYKVTRQPLLWDQYEFDCSLHKTTLCEPRTFSVEEKKQSPKELFYYTFHFTVAVFCYQDMICIQVYDICYWCSRPNNFLDCYFCKSFLSLEQSSMEEIYSLVYQIEVQEEQKSNRRAATNKMYLRSYPIANV